MTIFYGKLYETAQQIKYAENRQYPILNEKASSLSFIKGSWALFVLHESLVIKFSKGHKKLP
jgi:hypothetical protein